MFKNKLLKLKNKLFAKRLNYSESTKGDQDSIYEVEDKISLILILITSLFFIVFFAYPLFKNGGGGKFDLILSGILPKSPSSCEKFDNNYNGCTKAQQAGMGCFWSDCNSCRTTKDDPKKACERSQQKVAKIPKTVVSNSEQKPTIIPSGSSTKKVNCSEYLSDWKSCTEAQQKGLGCVWRGECSKCAQSLDKLEDICKK